MARDLKAMTTKRQRLGKREDIVEKEEKNLRLS
jgi:hypothetical protein